MTVIGNVLGSATATSLGTAPVSDTYVGTGPDAPSIFEVGDNANHDGVGMADVAYTSLWLQGNYDTVHAAVVWSTTISTRTLPASLYRASKPAWWPSGDAWPWAGPGPVTDGRHAPGEGPLGHPRALSGRAAPPEQASTLCLIFDGSRYLRAMAEEQPPTWPQSDECL